MGINIVTAVADENWISSVEAKFTDEFKDAELSFITDENYLKEYFSSPREISVLLIEDGLCGEEFMRHDIFRTLILSEEPPAQSLPDSAVKYISKYESLKSIILQIRETINKIKGKESPDLIYFYSPSGGAGAASCAIGAALWLAENFGRKVLYINTGSLQSFGCAAGAESFLDSFARKALEEGGENCFMSLKAYEEKSKFSPNLYVIPPFENALPSLNLSESNFKTPASQAAASKSYDCVIVSGDSAYTGEKSSFMGIADKIVLVTRQDENSAFEFNKFLSLIDYKNDKFIFVVNGYEQDKENKLKSGGASGSLRYVTVEKADGAFPYLTDSDIYADLAYSLNSKTS